MPAAEIPQLKFKTKAAWNRWLAKHHADSPGIWLEMAKAGAGEKSINHAEALDVALCYGWIDGIANRIDEKYWRQKFCPRRKQSLWSKINREKALAFIEQGLMQPAGLAAIEQAKANGRWEAAYVGPKHATVPEDLQAELDRRPKAAAFFATLDKQNRYAVLFRLQTARTPALRVTQLRRLVERLEEGKRFHEKAG